MKVKLKALRQSRDSHRRIVDTTVIREQAKYHIGCYNGLEEAISTFEKREPIYMNLGGTFS